MFLYWHYFYNSPVAPGTAVGQIVRFSAIKNLYLEDRELTQNVVAK